MIITYEFFSFNVWEWLLYFLVLERTESDLSKINWLRGVILLLPIVLVPWGRFPLCHTPIRPILAFPGSDFILRCGLRDQVIMRFASGDIRDRLQNKVISFCYLRAFFNVPWIFPVFVFRSYSSCQRHLIKKKVILHRFLSLYFSILREKQTAKRRKEREIEVLVEIWWIIEILP